MPANQGQVLIESAASQGKALEERLSALNFYGRKLNSASNLEQVYELTLDAMEQLLGFEHASFLVMHKDYLKVVCQRGYAEPLDFRLPLDGSKKGITVKAANLGKPVIINDVTTTPEYVPGSPDVKSELAVPVEIEGRSIGVLNVENRQLGAFDERDVTFLQILASHAATAMDNLEKRREIEKRSSQLASLMRSSAETIRSTDLRQRLQRIAEAINELGWRRVVISVRNEDLQIERPEDMVTVGLTNEERQYLWDKRPPGHVWAERFGQEFQRFRVGEFYHLPWRDPWVRAKFANGTVDSHLSSDEMVDWDPQDLLYAPLRLAEGHIVGVLSIDDPIDGKRPTKESLAPLELFINQSAVAIENAKLICQLNDARNQIKGYAEHLEEKVKERTRDLKESEERLKSILAASPDAITVTDLEGNIVECTEQALRTYRSPSREDFLGRNAFELIAERDRERAKDSMAKTLSSGLVRNVEYTLLTRDGSEYPAELSASLIRDALGMPIGFVAVTKNISDRKRMEQQLLKAERLAAIGEVAAMVGHDLRNPLTGIGGAAYYLRTKLGTAIDQRSLEMIELIEKDVEYSNKIITDLLDYSRELRLELTETAPKVLIADALKHAGVPENVRVMNKTGGSPKVMADVEMLARAFVNIIKNAVDAMPNGGTLNISSKPSSVGLEFAFADSGAGMSSEVLERIWTPFFTTKAKGMGLGLSICRRIVEAHNGRISVKSIEGKGTTFTVILPLRPDTQGGERIE
jgi:PAS domain S-box-containing protein